MNLPPILHYILDHSELLIGIFLAASFSIGILILIFGNKEGGGQDLAAIEASLKKVIEKIPQGARNPASAVISDEEELAPGTAAVVLSPEAEAGRVHMVEDLQFQVKEKEARIREIEDEVMALKRELATPRSEGGADPALQAKLVDLQNKLNEYAIIEEELADISRYKDENTRLKSELEQLKAGGAVAATPAPMASPAPAASAVEPTIQPTVQSTPEPQTASPEVAQAQRPDVEPLMPEPGMDASLESEIKKAAVETQIDMGPAKTPDEVYDLSAQLADALANTMMQAGQLSAEDLKKPEESIAPVDPMQAFQDAVDNQGASSEALKEQVATSVPVVESKSEAEDPLVQALNANPAPAQAPSAQDAIDALLNASFEPPPAAETAPANTPAPSAPVNPQDAIDALLNASFEPAAPEAPPVVAAAASEPAPSQAAPVSAQDSIDAILNGSVDTQKMIEELQTLPEKPDESSDPMAGILDTDKLLQEVHQLGGPELPKPEKPKDAQSAIDDLMSEFEQDNKSS